MQFESLKEFDKDTKRLLKKYRSLNSDLEDVKFFLNVRSDARPPFSFTIDNLGIRTCIIKVKKISCDSLKNRGVNSGLRLVYAYFKEDAKIILIELYHKNEKGIEDRDRILKYFE